MKGRPDHGIRMAFFLTFPQYGAYTKGIERRMSSGTNLSDKGGHMSPPKGLCR